jgi:hypothetical protein
MSVSISNAGVGDHPGDWAMREISESIFCALTDCMKFAPNVPVEEVPAVSALDKARPLPIVVRGFQGGEFNTKSLAEMRKWGAMSCGSNCFRDGGQ